MVQQAARDLTGYLKNRVGNNLRTVVITREEGYNIVHLHPELKRDYTEETFEEVVNSFRLKEPFLNPGTHERPIGERRAIVHYHEKAFVVQIPFSEADSILVSLSRETGQSLLQFIEECREQVVQNQSG